MVVGTEKLTDNDGNSVVGAVVGVVVGQVKTVE